MQLYNVFLTKDDVLNKVANLYIKKKNVSIKMFSTGYFEIITATSWKNVIEHNKWNNNGILPIEYGSEV